MSTGTPTLVTWTCPEPQLQVVLHFSFNALQLAWSFHIRSNHRQVQPRSVASTSVTHGRMDLKCRRVSIYAIFGDIARNTWFRNKLASSFGNLALEKRLPKRSKSAFNWESGDHEVWTCGDPTQTPTNSSNDFVICNKPYHSRLPTRSRYTIPARAACGDQSISYKPYCESIKSQHQVKSLHSQKKKMQSLFAKRNSLAACSLQATAKLHPLISR